jgi:outer membrane receptor for ferrienterochelin and colicins
MIARLPRVAALLMATLAAAGSAAAQPSTAIDVRDLPPLPEVVQDDSVRAIAVIAATQAEEDIVSGAAKRDQSLGNVASAVTVITADRLRRFGYRSVAEALRAVTGVYVSDDRLTERVGIRGLQILGDFNTHILVLVDGVTVNEPWNQYVGIGADMPVSIDEIARIELIRGPVSSVYGTNAFFGIVNIVTRGADQSPRAYGRASAGTFGNFHGNAGFAAGDVNRQVRGAFSFLSRAGEELTVPELGGAINADGNLAYQGSLVAHWDGLFAQLRGYSKDREVAAAPYDSAAGDERNRFLDRQLLGELGYTFEVGQRATVTGRGYFSRYQFKDYLVYEPDEANFRDIGDSLWFGGEVRGFIRVLPKSLLDVTLGAEAIWNDVTSEAFEEDAREEGVVVPTSFSTFGLYGELSSAPLPWLGLSVGMRFDGNSLFTENFSPRGALFLHHREDFGLKLLFADGFRYPSAYEAFFADEKTFVANPELAPERIRSFEAVLWGRPVPGLALRLSAFRWELEDIIELQPLAGTPFLRFENITTMTSTGGEVEASYRDTRGWLGAVSATYADVQRNEGMEPAPNAPALIFKAQASTPRLARLVHVSTELQVVSSRETRDPDRRARAHVGWNVALYAPDLKGFDVTLGARNLVGKREEIPTSDEVDRDAGAMPVVVMPGEAREIYARIGFSY